VKQKFKMASVLGARTGHKPDHGANRGKHTGWKERKKKTIRRGEKIGPREKKLIRGKKGSAAVAAGKLHEMLKGKRRGRK